MTTCGPSPTIAPRMARIWTRTPAGCASVVGWIRRTASPTGPCSAAGCSGGRPVQLRSPRLCRHVRQVARLARHAMGCSCCTPASPGSVWGCSGLTVPDLRGREQPAVRPLLMVRSTSNSVQSQVPPIMCRAALRNAFCAVSHCTSWAPTSCPGRPTRRREPRCVARPARRRRGHTPR